MNIPTGGHQLIQQGRKNYERMRLARIPSDAHSRRGNIMPSVPKTAAVKFQLRPDPILETLEIESA
jgi:hypothetical protein